MLVKNESDIELKVGQQVMNCEIKDQSGLNDFQKLPDQLKIPIPKVGINRFRIPMRFKHLDGSIMNHDCETSMWVNLKSGKTGINMSRLCAILQSESVNSVVDSQFFNKIISRYKDELRDNDSEELIQQTGLKIKFNYPLKQKSLKSDNWGWQYYACEVEIINKKVFLTVNYEYSSTCPCSLSMAKQYEQDYAKGITSEGNGIGVAHGQRSQATCKIQINNTSDMWIEKLIDMLREAIPTETQSLVKRVDEQAFAILNGSNPMFVEHASKRLFQVLNQCEDIQDWIVGIEHWESLHSHNACAVIYKGIENGLSEMPTL
jgi:GTP cyclohydrolase I